MLPVLFVVVAWPALDENSGTYDEPYHLAAAYTYVTRGDFRLGSEHPPLVKELIGLALLPLAPSVGADAERAFAAALERQEGQWVFGERFLYRDNEPQPLLRRGRLVVLALGALLVLLVSLWARDAFGLVAGAVAGCLAALDPNLLAHGTLATTDLGFTLFFVATLFMLRRTFRTLTPSAVLLTGVFVGAALASKHSAVLLVPAVIVLGLLRVIDDAAWPVRLGSARGIAHWRGRAATVAALLGCWTLVGWGAIWASYGFRGADAAGVETALPLSQWTQKIRSERVLAEILARGDPVPDDDVLAAAVAARPAVLEERVIEAASRYDVLPQPYLFGVAVASALAQIRSNYWLGEISLRGWSGYFPFALLVKTPVATLALAAAALTLLVIGFVARDAAGRAQRREALFVLVPALIVLAAAMASNVNIGLRHILPVVPLLCVLAGYVRGGAGAACRPASRDRGRRARVPARRGRDLGGATALPVVLQRGGGRRARRPAAALRFESRLGAGAAGAAAVDGGELRRAREPLLFRDRRSARYGIDLVPLPGSHFGDLGDLGTIGHAPRRPVLPGYVAISATHLQGTYLPEELRRSYEFLRRKRPVAVPGGSMYVYWVERWGE